MPEAVFQSSLTVTSSFPSSCFFFAPHTRHVRLIKSGTGAKITNTYLFVYDLTKLFEDIPMTIIADPVALPAASERNFQLVFFYGDAAADHAWRNTIQVIHKACHLKMVKMIALI
ncbi:MAG TPA: hypothetical protein VJP79_00620 [Nitrososphaera sp.]|nr:hypothetical protein [Nitrososphaera sp.]